MAELDAAARKRLKPGDFAIPPDQYPIHDRAHAADALGRVKQNGSDAEQAQVRRAVCKRYPDFPECQTPGAKIDAIRNGGDS